MAQQEETSVSLGSPAADLRQELERGGLFERSGEGQQWMGMMERREVKASKKGIKL